MSEQDLGSASDAPVGRTGRNLPMAIATGVALAVGIVGTLYLSRLAFLIFVGVFVLTAQTEFYTAVKKAGYDASVAIGLVVGGLLLLGAYHRGLPGVAFGLAVAVPATALWIAADPGRTHQAARGLGLTVFGILWIPFLASHIILLSLLPGGAGKTLVAIALAAFYDIGAYVFGVWKGKTPLAPTVSPKKSLEGALGGTLTIVVAALTLGPVFADLSRPILLLMALATAVTAPVGDLSESLVKRDLGIKDMGTLLPGHGGVLDRIDALLLSIPVSYWIVRWAA
ncbi:MAG: phosphatidate cytidylyltransferase [Actinomycetota bacterium]